MNDLERYFKENQGHGIHKWMHYFDIYDRHFAPYRGKDPVVVEIGVQGGGSLRMWKDYFGPGSKIYGIDHKDLRGLSDPENGIEVLIGNQNDRESLQEMVDIIGPIDILIDDGGHHMHQMINTFEIMYPAVKDGGLFLCEDTYTAYKKGGDGTLKWHTKGGPTYIEYTKNLIDQLHRDYFQDEANPSDPSFTKDSHSIHYYESIVVIEKKGPLFRRMSRRTGKGHSNEIYPLLGKRRQAKARAAMSELETNEDYDECTSS